MSKKSADLNRVAAVIVDKQGKMHLLKRLMEQLLAKLEARRSTLNSEGLELLAMTFFITGTNAHEEQDYAGLQVLLPQRDGCDAGAHPGHSP